MKFNTLIQPAAAAHMSEESSQLLRYWGQRLRQARTAQGLTRSALGPKLNLSVSTLQRLEAGAPEVAMGHYIAVADALKLSLLQQPSVRELMEHPIKLQTRARKPRDLF